MPLEFTTTREAAATHGVKVLVHGRAGAGKTVLCSTAPKPLIISAEAGLLSLAGTDIPTLVIHNLAELDEAYQFVAYSEHAKEFRTVCLDSISEIAEQCLSTNKAMNRDPRKAYGDMQDQVMSRMRWFRDLKGKHVYFSAKADMIKDEVSGVSRWGPMMPGQKLGPQLPYIFDEVFSLEVGTDENNQPFRYLRTKLSIQYDAKDRSGRLDEYEPPNLAHIFDKIAGATTPAGA